MAAHAEPKAAHSHHDHAPGLAFVRVGGRVVNLAHVASVELPVAGDPKKPLTAHFAQGGSLSLSGADADAVLAAPGDCCDVTPAKPEKPAPATPAKPEKVDKGDKAG
jgi:hypothetical protein